MKIKDYMKKDFRTVSPHTSMHEVARLFFETGESVLPVTESDGTLVGLILIDDFILIFLPHYIDLIRNLDFIHDFGALERSSFSVEEKLFVAEDLMKEDVPVLDEEDSVLKAAAVLHKLDLPRIPITRDKQLVGMMSKNDVCRAIYDMEGHQ
ncbi:MAG: CBS domain-containing protein [bacterium]|nr:MAG: CBS domain-containing protein [bacterium]